MLQVHLLRKKLDFQHKKKISRAPIYGGGSYLVKFESGSIRIHVRL